MKVSVIIPTFNRCDILPRAIKSVLAQGYGNFEIIIIDDASCDNTEFAVSRIRDPRVRYIKQSHNQGAPVAKNVGIKEARGGFVTFLDSDDEYLPGKLSRQVEVLNRNSNVGIVYSGWEWVEERTGKLQKKQVPGLDGRINGLPRWVFNIGPDLMLRTGVARDTLYEEGRSTFEHLSFLWRLWQKTSAIAVPEVLVRCYSHSGARASDAIPLRVEWLRSFIESNQSLVESDPRGKSYMYLKLGALMLRHDGDLADARRYLLKAVTSNPSSLRGWRFLASAYMSRY